MEMNLEKCTLTDQEVIYILKNRKVLLDATQSKLEQAYANIESLDEIIRRVSPKAVRYDTEKICTGNTSGGLDRVLLKRDSEHKKQVEELEKAVYELIKEEEKIYRVFQCLAMMPADDYELLDALYIKGCTWEYYASKKKISLTTLSRKKRKALEGIVELYAKGLGSDNSLMQ